MECEVPVHCGMILNHIKYTVNQLFFSFWGGEEGTDIAKPFSKSPSSMFEGVREGRLFNPVR